MSYYARISFNDDAINSFIEDTLGYKAWIDLGLTGRKRVVRWSQGESIEPERAEFSLYDVLERAGVLCDDDEFADAAKDGIRSWLEANAEQFHRKIDIALAQMRADQLASTENIIEEGATN